MTFQKALGIEEIGANGLGRATIGGKEFVIVRLGDSFYAMDGLCTHSEGELWDGALVDGQLVCPIHEGRFDPTTGTANSQDDWVSDLKSYATRVEDGAVWVDA